MKPKRKPKPRSWMAWAVYDPNKPTEYSVYRLRKDANAWHEFIKRLRVIRIRIEEVLA